MLPVLAKCVSIMLSVVMFLSTPLNLVTGKKQAKIARAEEECRVSFATISDLHLRGNFKLIFQGMLELGLEDFSGAKDRLDAVVFDGDITNNGTIEEWDVFAEALSNYDIADNTIIVTGNHDTWGPYTDDDKWDDPEEGFKPTFIKYNKIIAGREITEMYYSEIINGYHFIVMGAEEDHVWSYISPEQISWLDAELAKSADTGLPTFVFLHQPVNETHGLPYTWELDDTQPPEEGGIGEQNAEVVKVLKKYDNIFFISGHIHAGLKVESDSIGADYASVEYMKNDNGNNITLINLPSYMYPDFIRGGHIANGCGWVVEAYDTKVMLRARNFGTGTWLTKYDVTVDLV